MEGEGFRKEKVLVALQHDFHKRAPFLTDGMLWDLTESEGNACSGSYVINQEHGFGCKWHSNDDYHRGG